ncbi:MAG: tRNA lysidine(34) synthetase TilS, partial [Deltaproteobacteria bacterium]|nr:tRNA lysidine(34) synthetase TilS [Deltaproteobacteria bacterium]
MPRPITRTHADLPRRVARILAESSLLLPGEGVVIGVSGGLDSVTLLHLLHRLAASLALRCHVAHVNYRLRGRAADADERAVRAFATSLGLPCSVKRCRRPPARGNRQAWARRVRYDFFADVARRVGASVVAVAQQQEDQCETVLMNLIRG